MEKLLIRTKILFQESAASYLYRVASVNHYSNIYYLATCINSTIAKINNNFFNEEQLNKISFLSEVCKDTLHLSTHNKLNNYLGPKLFNQVIMRNKIKFCPQCIYDSHFHRYTWGVLSINLCTDHLVELIDCCQGCGKAIPLSSFMNGCCTSCGFKFLSSKSVVLNRNELFCKAQLALYNAFFIEHYSNLPLGLSLKDFLLLSFHTFHLLEGMKSYISNSEETIQIFHNKSMGYRKSSAMALALGNVYWMLQDFPNHYYRLLTDFCNKNYNKKQRFYEKKKRFEELFETVKYASLKKVYDQFWLEKLDQGVIRRDFSVFRDAPEILQQKKYVSKDEIRTNIGMCYDTVEKLSINKKLVMRTTQKGAIKRYMVEKDSLNLALKEKIMLISKKEAALILGIQRDSVPKLINAGFLRTYKITPNSVEKLELQEVKNLVIRCRGEVVKGKIEGISFHEALIKYSVNGLKIIHLIQFILNGVLQPFSDTESGSLADNYFKIHELEKCIMYIKEAQINDVGYFMSDLKRLLHVGNNTIRRLAIQKVLVPQKIIYIKDGRKRYLYNKEEVEAFIENKA
ncbi:helix-turn-helix domain-containing protein [Paenibacillus filicis]|uniref:Helix-turn-helix domain-containing protein n=1 Tax=Paenibacillus gyeongsangnamensis TaxID=3388067 RepID=A0ABT4QC30_9BACL|nr:helix-turn-helix domain-containing protein [Paenibacillus filicis]MCZ8514341.1 helix-turn-helix domain-containing protein [Paenibacillus filicis]